jgi:hypothetical protein
MSVGRSLRAVAVALIGLGFCATAQATLWVYQLPDGSRMITDHIVLDRSYKLVRMTRDAKGLGRDAVELHTPFYDPSAYDRLIHQLAREHKIDPALIKAVMRVESAFNPYATSHKGALGLMQLMPDTARRYGIENLYDPGQNIEAGVRHLKFLLKRFNHRHDMVLAAYNAGENAVYRYKGIPPYKETRDYVRKVKHFHKLYKRELVVAGL